VELTSKPLFSWFSPKRGDEVFELTAKTFTLTAEIIESLYKMVQADIKGDKLDSASHFATLHEKDIEVINIRRDAINLVSKNKMFPEEKMDIIDLIRAADLIADAGNEAGKLLSVIDLSKVPKELKETALEMAKSDHLCTESLTLCFKSMKKDLKKCIDLTNKVEEYETRVDELYRTTREYLGKLEFPGWSAASIYLLIEFLNTLETIADWCENASDMIKSISVKVE
jgi:predicted phosphate transport protein (TIGR00153 family)